MNLNHTNGVAPTAPDADLGSYVTVHIDQYDRLECCRRLLEIIAVGDSSDPVADAKQELVAHGFWNPDASGVKAALSDERIAAAWRHAYPDRAAETVPYTFAYALLVEVGASGVGGVTK